MKPPTNDIIPQGFKMTELGVLPEEWEVVRLGEYCNVFSGYAFKSDDFCNNGVLVVKIGNLQNGSIVFNTKDSFFPREKINDDISKFILNEGDILIALTGATTGKISLVPKSVNGALLNQRVGKFSIYNDLLYKSFARYYFLTDEFQNHIKINIMQSAQGNISPKQIETFPIPLPPLLEQQKIAAVLSAVQEAKEKTEAVIDAAKALKKSMMKHLFTYGPVSPEETDNVPLKETEIGSVPEDWEVVRLGDIFDVQQGKQLSEKESKDGKLKKPFLRTSNLNWGHINILSVDEMYFTSEEYEKLKLKNGDILVCEGGDIGRTALYRGELTECAYQNHIHRLRVKKDNADVEYFVAWMEYAIKQRKMYTHTANRTTIPNLSGSRLKGFIIPLPPLPIQQKIASILSAIDAKIEAEENKKKALEELFKSLLHNLMTAKIRVNHLGVTS